MNQQPYYFAEEEKFHAELIGQPHTIQVKEQPHTIIEWYHFQQKTHTSFDLIFSHWNQTQPLRKFSFFNLVSIL